MRGEYPSPIERVRAAPELPPHARRILIIGHGGSRSHGTTSACAENTSSGIILATDVRNYLRVRGEYWRNTLNHYPLLELPPRARRIRRTGVCRPGNRGTTSACAENTPGVAYQRGEPGNYLRVRGEYPSGTIVLIGRWELPPRARRIPPTLIPPTCMLGTTSACAENTC